MDTPRINAPAPVVVVCIALAAACASAKGSNHAATTKKDAGTSPHADAAQASTDSGAAELSLCSGCPSETRDVSDTTLRFHHVHLNVADLAASSAFYRQFFGAEAVKLNGQSDALWLAPMLFLMHKVEVAPSDTLNTGLDHVGRGSDDPIQWFTDVSKQGVMGDPRRGSSATPTQLGTLTFIYVRGPDAERMEVYNVGTVVVPGHEADAKQFQHVHFITPDVDATAAWYAALVGQQVNTNALGRDVTVDRTSLFFQASSDSTAGAATDDRPLGHIAFSVSDLSALRARCDTLGITIVAEPALAPEGFRSFFVRAPDLVLLELVEAGPVSLL